MRRLLAFSMLLLLVAAAAEARVVQAPDTERGGQAVPGKAIGPGAGMSYAGGFGWFGVPDLDVISRLTAAARAELAAGRPVWRRPRAAVIRPAWRLTPAQRQMLPRLH